MNHGWVRFNKRTVSHLREIHAVLKGQGMGALSPGLQKHFVGIETADIVDLAVASLYASMSALQLASTIVHPAALPDHSSEKTGEKPKNDPRVEWAQFDHGAIGYLKGTDVRAYIVYQRMSLGAFVWYIAHGIDGEKFDEGDETKIERAKSMAGAKLVARLRYEQEMLRPKPVAVSLPSVEPEITWNKHMGEEESYVGTVKGCQARAYARKISSYEWSVEDDLGVLSNGTAEGWIGDAQHKAEEALHEIARYCSAPAKKPEPASQPSDANPVVVWKLNPFDTKPYPYRGTIEGYKGEAFVWVDYGPTTAWGYEVKCGTEMIRKGTIEGTLNDAMAFAGEVLSDFVTMQKMCEKGDAPAQPTRPPMPDGWVPAFVFRERTWVLHCPEQGCLCYVFARSSTIESPWDWMVSDLGGKRIFDGFNAVTIDDAKRRAWNALCAHHEKGRSKP